ncbi:hypothetical protein MKW98_009866 [Papaver atlanticum]|uniref:Uncharacterized protein n=1 Tax=Papaver atlanticum TaxID=357466 RepID=A0AAD4XSY2_9MAGN|nr:hypothetical protein MKW98_009866 [Papaver atlanticum]
MRYFFEVSAKSGFQKNEESERFETLARDRYLLKINIALGNMSPDVNIVVNVMETISTPPPLAWHWWSCCTISSAIKRSRSWHWWWSCWTLAL